MVQSLDRLARYRHQSGPFTGRNPRLPNSGGNATCDALGDYYRRHESGCDAHLRCFWGRSRGPESIRSHQHRNDRSDGASRFGHLMAFEIRIWNCRVGCLGINRGCARQYVFDHVFRPRISAATSSFLPSRRCDVAAVVGLQFLGACDQC